MEAIILAGGAGTRLKGVLPNLPKPLAPIDGRPFLEYQIDYWISQGVTRFILSIGYMRDRIKAHFGNSYNGCEIDYAEEITPLGTGGGMLLAREKLNDKNLFLVLNGDTFFKVDLQQLISFHQLRSTAMSVVLFKSKTTGRYMGVEIKEDGEIVSFKSEPGGDQLANGGVYLFEEKLFTQLPWKSGDKFSLESDLFEHLLASGRKLYGMGCDGSFIDIGVPADYFRANTVIDH